MRESSHSDHVTWPSGAKVLAAMMKASISWREFKMDKRCAMKQKISLDNRPSGTTRYCGYSSARHVTLVYFVLFLLCAQCFLCTAEQQENGDVSKPDKSPDHSVLPPPVSDGNQNTGALWDNSGGQSNASTTNSTNNATQGEDPNAQSLKTLAYWMNAVFTNIVVILGTVGNALTIVILTNRVMRSSTNVYLSALAVWDIVVLVCTLLLIGIEAIPEAVSYRNYVYAYVVAWIYPLALVAQTATIWLTVSFTVERYIAVCHPLKAARMCTIRRAKIVILGMSLGSGLYNVPRWFEYRPVEFLDPGLNQTIMIVNPTEFVQNPWYTQIYFSWLYVPIMCIIPLTTLSVLNTFLVLAVRRSQKQRKDMNVRQCRENNVTIMLASVVVVFILCQVPALVYNLAYAINREYVEERSFGYRVLSIIRNFLVTFNSAINFILYCALGQKFRRIFLQTFCKILGHDAYMPMSGIHQSQFVAGGAGGPGTHGGHAQYHHKGARQYYANNHAMLLVRKQGGASSTDGHSSTTTNTTLTNTTHSTAGTNSSHDALLDDGSGGQNEAREMRTYTAARAQKPRVPLAESTGIPVTSSGYACASGGDSDTEAYDVALEQLLTSSQKSDAALTSPYLPQNRPKLFGIKNSVPVN